MLVEVEVQAVGPGVHQPFQPPRAHRVLRLDRVGVDEQLHPQVLVDAGLALRLRQAPQRVEVIGFHPVEVVFGLSIHQAEDGVGVGPAVHVGNAPIVPDDGDVLGRLLPAGDVLGRGSRGSGCRKDSREENECFHERNLCDGSTVGQLGGLLVMHVASVHQGRGVGPLGILAMLVIVLVGNYPVAPAGALLVLLWVRWSRTPWRDIGYVRPESWPRDVAVGIAFGIAFKFLMKAVVMPPLGAPPVNPAFHYLAGNQAALPGAVYAMVVGAGFGEETVFRGYLFERFGKLFGPGVRARTLDRKSTRLNSSHLVISYAVFCLKKKTGVMASALRAAS